MLFLLTLLTAGYFALVVWVRRSKQRAASAPATGLALPTEDLPPSTAVGWPPQGSGFGAYVDRGFDDLDAYLSDDQAA